MKKGIVVIVLLFLSMKVFLKAQSDTFCLSKEEAEVYQLLNAYRKDYKLPEIPLSVSLCKVAKIHVIDLMNHPASGKCNMHSWSDKGNWKPCCYTSDHKEAACMWMKPKELTGYSGNGYEIAHWNSGGATPEGAIEGWKNSPGHNAVMINSGIWDEKWEAVGIGLFGNYCVIWFGNEADSEGEPTRCK